MPFHSALPLEAVSSSILDYPSYTICVLSASQGQLWIKMENISIRWRCGREDDTQYEAQRLRLPIPFRKRENSHAAL